MQSYSVIDDLECVYDSLLEPYTVNEHFIEAHFLVTGVLKDRILNRIAWHNPLPYSKNNLFLLFSHDLEANRVMVEFGYGPGEIELTFVYGFDVPFDRTLSSALLHWLAGLR